ncbi:MAG: NADH-quinone oxidoreductase subunit L, partial [Marinobacter sp.]|nr:NADH-quinone oxidoreductase subunit L [Marinobacter sp.]
MLIQDITGVLATLIPGLLVIAALGMQRRSRWRIAKTVATTHLALALILAGLSFSQPDLRAATVEPSILHVSPLTGILLVLISFIGWVIVRFSEQYMGRGERDSHYLRWLLMTLAAVTLVLVSNHLLLFVAGWIGISLALHHLLMFYPERPRAALAAHKKFLFARVAELSLCGAALLLYNQHGTLYIQSILADYPVAELSWQQQLAACLLAVTALIKCAQLPVHGWLMQVVEAPTPVSALLHAGVINLGGFMLILFSPLLVQSTPAQWLILVIAGLTAVLAALIMMTRISIKVKLAWSTSAQMGLMLVQCALGLFELALLHLLAHSCYKAYGFLS